MPILTGKIVGGERIDSRLDAAVRKACAEDPAGRYQTANRIRKTERETEQIGTCLGSLLQGFKSQIA